MATEKETKSRGKLNAHYERVSEFFRVQNGAQVDVHYRGQREGEALREFTAYSNVPEAQVEDFLVALNQKPRHGNKSSPLQKTNFLSRVRSRL